jgi:nitrous oxide reductase accessory protein NosL
MVAIRRPRPARRTVVPAAALATLLAAAQGCGPPPALPVVPAGAACAACGMAIHDLRFACARRVDRGWRFYDSIECLLRESPGAGTAWLADYDGKALHAADSMWVVRGELPSPMGGGLAAFRDRGAAQEVAAAVSGRMSRLHEISSGSGVVR